MHCIRRTVVLWVALLAILPFAHAETIHTYDLYAGQHELVGQVVVDLDADTVTFEVDEPWCLTETHLYVGDEPPAKSAPGRFNYQGSHDCLDMVVYQVDEDLDHGTCLAFHAVVAQPESSCIDFEDFLEMDNVSLVPTASGDVSFYTTDYWPLRTLVVGDMAVLTPDGRLPQVATPLTSPPLENIVGFTAGGLQDDVILDANGTGAAGNTLTDPQDPSQIPLLRHAYSQFLAVVIDVSAVPGVTGLSFAAIDLDHNETWRFQAYDGLGTLLEEITMTGPDASGDGKAFAIDFAGPVARVAIFGGNNLGQDERLGYAIDNVCVRTERTETAWGATSSPDFMPFGRGWGGYIRL